VKSLIDANGRRKKGEDEVWEVAGSWTGPEDHGGGFGERIDGNDGNVGEMRGLRHLNPGSAVSHPAGYPGPGTSGTLYPYSGISYEKIVQKKDPGKILAMCRKCRPSCEPYSDVLQANGIDVSNFFPGAAYGETSHRA
jgi:hypothetical protein